MKKVETQTQNALYGYYRQSSWKSRKEVSRRLGDLFELYLKKTICGWWSRRGVDPNPVTAYAVM